MAPREGIVALTQGPTCRVAFSKLFPPGVPPSSTAIHEGFGLEEN